MLVLMMQEVADVFAFPQNSCGLHNVAAAVGTINTHCGYNDRILGSRAGFTHSATAEGILHILCI